MLFLHHGYQFHTLCNHNGTVSHWFSWYLLAAERDLPVERASYWSRSSFIGNAQTLGRFDAKYQLLSDNTITAFHISPNSREIIVKETKQRSHRIVPERLPSRQNVEPNCQDLVENNVYAERKREPCLELTYVHVSKETGSKCLFALLVIMEDSEIWWQLCQLAILWKYYGYL